jgi:hypothetical protein
MADEGRQDADPQIEPIEHRVAGQQHSQEQKPECLQVHDVPL